MSQRKKENKITEVDDSALEEKIIFGPVPHEFFGFRILRFIVIITWAIIVTTLVWLSIPFGFILDPIYKKYKISKWYSPLEMASRAWSIGILWVLNIKVRTEGFELYKDYEQQPSVLMYSHSSYLDPIVLQGYSPIPCKYIYKKELIYLFPWLFLLAYFVGHIPINRGKKNSAISSINDAASIIETKKYCVAISPEGTRSKDGNLIDFKKGPFHLAMKSNSTIVPVVFFGNNQIWNSNTFFPHSGNLVVRCLPPIKIEKDDTVDSISKKVRVKMLKSLHTRPVDYKTFTDNGIFHTILYLGSLSYIIYTGLNWFGYL
ncbi:hypothetical protein RB653_005010 [Dictyostelium firmibasis]|uniref:Phospholipid/glycerol acyltransferase domain-containing protein n=1 Tax=Dictyostelium firmibasis TaxID=79012 RepID=A0AAN7Z0M6_9MYCE